jgi:hypothetical protein
MNMARRIRGRGRPAKVERISAIDFDYAGKHYFILSEDEKRNMMIKGRGTFTPDHINHERSRFHHLEMLSKLSFPKKYKNVVSMLHTP